MPFTIENLDCDIFGDFKVGDNAVYNANILSDLIETNDHGRFNKLIVLQVASLLEVACIQIFYRARNYHREGVPNISEKDRQAIAERQIDKFAVIIDNLNKYGILNKMGDKVYDDLHNLRRCRNKIHIQGDVELPEAQRDEDRLFTKKIVDWAVDLNWSILQYLNQNYARPDHIKGNVKPLRLPRRVQTGP